jgi:hypothetical protein
MGRFKIKTLFFLSEILSGRFPIHSIYNLRVVKQQACTDYREFQQTNFEVRNNYLSDKSGFCY